jgi:hypothetical protein
MTDQDRALMKRLTIVLAALFVFVFAWSRLQLLYGEKFFEVTASGKAQWIWMQHRLADGNPVAFYATHDFDLPPQRNFTHLKVLGDPEYTLYFNGVEVGGRRVGEESTLDVYDVSALARDKANRIVIAARSPNGVGGLIASIDLAPDFLNHVFTNGDWHIVTQWHPDILTRDTAPFFRPMLLGRPPARRWNYLTRQPANVFAPPAGVMQARETFSFRTAMPQIEVVDGVAVAGTKPIDATAYDFGVGARGRLRLTLPKPSTQPLVVNVRFHTERNDLFAIEGEVEPFVFAAGETTVTDEQQRIFRYVEIYGSAARAEVLQ